MKSRYRQSLRDEEEIFKALEEGGLDAASEKATELFMKSVNAESAPEAHKGENDMSENQSTTRFPTPAEIEETRKERISPLLEEVQRVVRRNLEESHNSSISIMVSIKYHPVMTALKEVLVGAGWNCTYSVEAVPDQRGEEMRKEIRLEVSPFDENS